MDRWNFIRTVIIVMMLVVSSLRLRASGSSSDVQDGKKILGVIAKQITDFIYKHRADDAVTVEQNWEKEKDKILQNLDKVNIDINSLCWDTPVANNQTTIKMALLHQPVSRINYKKESYSCHDSDTYLCILDSLLKHPNINVNVRDSEGRTPLFYAMLSCGHPKIAKKLLERTDVDVNAVTNMGNSTLIRAAARGFLDIVKELLGKKDLNLNTRSYRGMTALLFALDQNDGNHKDIAFALLKESKDRYTKNTDSEELLDLSAQSELGKTALIRAVINNWTDFVSELCEWHKTYSSRGSPIQRFDININARDVNGYTALMHAIDVQGNLAIKLLEFEDIDVNCKSCTEGKSAWTLAMKWTDWKVLSLLASKVEADVNTPVSKIRSIHSLKDECEKFYESLSDKTKTVFGLAIGEIIENRSSAEDYEHQKKILLDLAKNPAFNVNAKDKFGSTPLMCVLGISDDRKEQDLCNVVEALCNRTDIDLNAKNSEGYSALMLAVKNHWYEAVKLLVSKGADVLVRKKGGNKETALDLAKEWSKSSLNSSQQDVLSELERADKEQKSKKVEEVKAFGGDVTQDQALKSGGVAQCKKEWFEYIRKAMTENLTLLATSDTEPIKSQKKQGEQKIKERIKTFQDQGLDINVRGDDGKTALHCAASSDSHNQILIKCLVEAKADVNARNKDGQTALMLAAKNDNQGIVHALRIKGADPDLQDHEGKTALMLAVEKENDHIVEVLCKPFKGDTEKYQVRANTKLRDHNGYTALMMAAKTGQTKVLEEILKQSNDCVNLQNFAGQTALMLAINEKCEDGMKILLNGGASTTVLDHEWNSALSLAIQAFPVLSDFPDKLFQEEIINVPGVREKRTPLHVAAACCQNGSKWIDKLIENKADVNARDSKGKTALMHALGLGKKSYESVYSLLKSESIDLDMKDNDGKTVSKYVDALQRKISEQRTSAAEGKTTSPVEGVKSLMAPDGIEALKREMATFSTKREAQKDAAKRKDSKTPGELKAAMAEFVKQWAELIKKICGGTELKDNDKDQINKLIECVDIDTTFCIGGSEPKLTALQHAAQSKNVELVKYLLGKGASVTHYGADGKTALMLAMKGKDIGIVKALIEKLKNVKLSQHKLKARDINGNTALIYAIENGWIDGINELLEAKPSAAIMLVKDRDTALLYAIRQFSDPSGLDLLLECAKRVINIHNKLGKTPLHVAAECNHLKWIDKLLKAGADVNACDKGKPTALALALEKRHFEVAERLLRESDINVDVKVGGKSVKDYVEGLKTSCVGDDANKKRIEKIAQRIEVRLAEQTQNAAKKAEQKADTKDSKTPGELKKAMAELVEQWAKLIADIYKKKALDNDDTKEMDKLIECVDIDTTFCIGGSEPKLTALQHAAQSKNVELVKYLLGKGASVTHYGADGKTALMLAMKGKDIGIVNALIEKAGEDCLRYRDSDGKTALIYAIENEWTECINKLLNLKNPDMFTTTFDNNYNSALSHAVENFSDPSELDLLLEKTKPTIKSSNRSGETPLHIAARKGCCTAWIDKLLKAGADVNACDRGKPTALALALEKRHFEVAERLLRESDINVDVKVGGKSVKDYVEGLKTFYTDDVNKKKIEKIAQRIEVRLAEQETKVKDFETPGELKTAMTKLSGKWTEWIKKLFGGNDLMASVNDENQINELIECVDIDETFCIGDSGPKLTALQHAARLGNRKLVDHLLGKGASVTHCGADGKTALMLAMENGNISIVNALIAKADSSNQLLDMRDNKGKTALMYAVEKGWTDGVKALLEAGASPIALDNTNESVLSCAVRRPLSDPTEIDSLIQKAQEVINVPNKSGETPLHVAAREGCTAWIDKLLVGGADVNARDRGKLTALALALKEKHFDVAERLLQEPDIDVDVKVEDGESVKDHAEKLQNSSNGAVKQSVASLVRDINSRLAQQKKERQEIEDQKTAKKAKEQVEAELKTAQDELTVTKAGAEQAVFELNQQKIEAEKIQNALTSLAQKLDDAHIDISQLDNSERLAQFEIEDNTRRLWSLLCEENKPTNWEKDAVELIESGNIDLNRYNSVEKGLVGQKDETVVEVTPLAYAMGAVNGPYFSIMEALLAHQDNVNMSCPAMGDGFHGYTPLDFAFQRKEVFDRNDRFRSVVKLLVQILGSRGTLPANADVWEWLQHQDSADMEDVRRMLSEILRKQARRSGAYGRSTSETGRLSEENARLAAEKEDLEAKLDTLSHENLQLTDQIEKLLGKKYKLEAGKTLDVEENREPQEGQELQENVSQKTKKRSKLDADPRIIQGESKDVEEEKEPLSDGSAAEAENEALRNQIKQLQDEIARRSEAVNPKKGLSEIAITPNKASESAEKPEEDSNQENVAVDKPLEEKIPVPEEKDPEAKEVKAFVENNQIKIDVGQFLLDNLSPPVSADNTQNKSMGKVSVRFGQSNVGSHSSLANRPTPEARSQLNANGIPHGRAAALMCQRIMKMLGRSKQKELFVMLKKSETQQGQQALIKIFRILQKIRQNGRRNVPLISSLPSSEAMNFRVGGFPPVKSSGPNPQQSVVPEQKPQLIYESGVRQ